MRGWVLALLGAGMLLSGCSTTSMKGTPFYTGEYDVREGPAADRVNLWPVLYYRDPALSVLWPLMEFSPDHLAVRPLYSIHDRESENPVYNVLWPIGRFDTANQDYRFFPVYWGDEYFNVFPLYWHNGDPLSGTGYNSLFPLWILNSTKTGSGLHVMWPFYANYNYAECQGWRLWPLYGSKDYLDGHDRFYAWPLGRVRGDSDGASSYLFPLYGYDKTPERTQFISLPYSRSLAAKPLEKSWDLALPLWYRGWEGDTFSWSAIPALSWGIKSEGQYDNKYLAGLVRSAETEDSRSHHVLPFYYHSRSNNASAFYSLPWWSATNEDGSGWSASFPFYYKSHSMQGSTMLTPLYAQQWKPDGSSAWKCYVPFVYFDQGKEAHFMTLLGGAWHLGDERRWIALPLLSGGRSDADSGKTVWLAGLAGKKWDAQGHEHHVFPLYYSAPEKGTFTSLAYARWNGADGSTNRFIPLLLSGKKTKGDTKKTDIVGGLVSWKTKQGEVQKSHVIPLYWWEKDAYLITALYGRNSYMNYYLTPLVGSYKDPNSGSWVFPFYRHKKDVDGDVDGSYLLLGKYRTEENRKLRGFWPLFKYDWNQRKAWVKKEGPPVSYEKTDEVESESKTISYLLLGKNEERWKYKTGGGETFESLLTWHRKKSGFWPLFNREQNEQYSVLSGDPELESRSRESNTLLLAWSREKWRYEDTVLSGHSKRGGFFPLWKQKLRENPHAGELEKTSAFLWFLYDTRHEKQAEKEHDYTRRRVLWRLVHHENLNGDASTDIFPGITVDSYQNGYYKCSVLWRLFRYEKDPDGGTSKLDLFFIPLRR